MGPSAIDQDIIDLLRQRVRTVETAIDRDLVVAAGPIYEGLARQLHDALRGLATGRRKGVTVLLETDGGIVEVAERMAEMIRARYEHVEFLILGSAMSAGTILTMSGNRIVMDDYAALGPIDPQVQRGDVLVPAQSYIAQYERLIERAARGVLTDAEFALIQSFDPAELHSFEQATQLSVALLKTWLAEHKFRDWDKTEASGRTVTRKMREDRAEAIARDLANHEKWHSHSRALSRNTLREALRLRIDDFETLHAAAEDELRRLHRGSLEYGQRMQFISFVLTRDGLAR